LAALICPKTYFARNQRRIRRATEKSSAILRLEASDKNPIVGGPKNNPM
jgi:hypothetical protein